MWIIVLKWILKGYVVPEHLRENTIKTKCMEQGTGNLNMLRGLLNGKMT